MKRIQIYLILASAPIVATSNNWVRDTEPGILEGDYTRTEVTDTTKRETDYYNEATMLRIGKGKSMYCSVPSFNRDSLMHCAPDLYWQMERVILKAEYEAVEVTHDKEGKPKEQIKKWILQIAPGKSYYYNPQTFFVDSLKNDPTGKVIYDNAFSDALREFSETGADAFAIMRDKGLMPEGNYKCLKDFSTNSMTVWDSNGADRYEYEVEMNDLSWELCDSTSVVLDYECTLATVDYHGRRWNAWFAPEVPVQDGPWQLSGLPGLIMKAETEDGAYAFMITGLQQCNEPFKPNHIDPDRLYKTKRKSYLKMRDYGRRNRSAQIAAMTNGNVKVNADYIGTDDYLETDYHE